MSSLRASISIHNKTTFLHIKHTKHFFKKNLSSVSTGVQFPTSEGAAVALQERLLREAAAFIITNQIPAFVSVMFASHFVPFYILLICRMAAGVHSKHA